MRNLSVQAYRGWLMLWIVLFHYTYRITELYPDIQFPLQFENGGKIGVMFFFVISGFFLFKGILKLPQQNIIGYCKIIANKYWRLWLPYIFAIVLIFSICAIWELPGRTVSWQEFLLDTILIYHPKIAFVDSAHWFIGHLICIQIIVSLFLLIKRELRSRAIYAYEIFLCIVLVINNVVHDYITVKLMCILCVDSSLKVLLGYNLLNISRGGREGKNYHIIMFISLLTCYSITINLLWVPLYTILTYFVLKKDVRSNLLKPLMCIGDISFEWYLVHQNIGFLIIIVFYHNGVTNETVLIIPVLVTMVLGFCIHCITKKIPQKIYTI